jgi:hypothetical protein
VTLFEVAAPESRILIGYLRGYDEETYKEPHLIENAVSMPEQFGDIAMAVENAPELPPALSASPLQSSSLIDGTFEDRLLRNDPESTLTIAICILCSKRVRQSAVTLSRWIGSFVMDKSRRLAMSSKSVLYSVRIGVVTAVFSAGFLCGLMAEQSAHAQLGEMGQEMLKKAESSGGALGSVAQLGTAITDMEKNVNGLQQNLDTLKKVQAALGGK